MKKNYWQKHYCHAIGEGRESGWAGARKCSAATSRAALSRIKKWTRIFMRNEEIKDETEKEGIELREA